MNWFWLNIPLATLFFLMWTLVPLWMVIKHPDTGPQPDQHRGGGTGPAADPPADPQPPASAAQPEPDDSDAADAQPKQADQPADEVPVAA